MRNTCSPPASSKNFFIKKSFSIESSSPIVNNNRITPTSAITAMLLTSDISWKPYGPIIIPATRNPTKLGTFILLKRKIIGTETRRMITMSRMIKNSCREIVYLIEDNLFNHTRLNNNTFVLVSANFNDYRFIKSKMPGEFQFLQSRN